MKASSRELIRADELERLRVNNVEGVGQEYLVPDAWTPEHVEYRLLEAFETLAQLPGGRPGPKPLRGQSIPYSHSFDDVRDWAHEGDESWREQLLRQWEGRRRRVDAASVKRMDDALGWQATYLTDSRGLAFCLAVWIRTKIGIHPRRMAKVYKAAGIPRRTAYRQRKAAARVIADGLTRDGIPVD